MRYSVASILKKADSIQMMPVEAVKAVQDAITKGAASWPSVRWAINKYFGKIEISDPANRKSLPRVHPAALNIRGTYKGRKCNYWLLTAHGDKYWPQGKIRLQPDGQWEETININASPGPRTVTIYIVRATDFMQSVFDDYKARGAKHNDWDPMRLVKLPAWHFAIVSGLVIHIQG